MPRSIGKGLNAQTAGALEDMHRCANIVSQKMVNVIGALMDSFQAAQG